MLTAAEKKALLLTVTFLLLGAGIKLWIRAKTELGPFPSLAPLAASSASEDPADSAPKDISPDDPTQAAPADTANPGIAQPDPAPEDPSGPPAAEPKGAAKEAKPRPKGKPRGKVDLNLASMETLAEVPGIGPKTAVAILEYRNSRGGIRDLRDLLEVKGIGEKKLEKIRPWVLSSAGGAEAGPEAAQ